MESTGSYHELLATLADERGFVVYIVNPKDLRHYARSLGVRGKTDRNDAEMLARFIDREGERLLPFVMPSASQKRVSSLLSNRQTV